MRRKFSQAIFGPGGLLEGASRTVEERKALVPTDLYKWLQGQLAELRRKEVQEFEAETAALSGLATISIPKSMHAALKREAKFEGRSCCYPTAFSAKLRKL